LPWSAAVLLGAIVGPTDETAAIVIAERLQIPKRLIIVIKAESPSTTPYRSSSTP